jgi:predicted RNA-binding protein with PUA-like domain
MKQGELAFFYHSNCKEPGIAGTMEIVREHSPDCEHTNLPTYLPTYQWSEREDF